jgi:hypothetical protein
MPKPYVAETSYDSTRHMRAHARAPTGPPSGALTTEDWAKEWGVSASHARELCIRFWMEGWMTRHVCQTRYRDGRLHWRPFYRLTRSGKPLPWRWRQPPAAK